MNQRPVACTKKALGSLVRSRGLPVTVEAAGSGKAVEISQVKGMAQSLRDILAIASAFGNGCVVK